MQEYIQVAPVASAIFAFTVFTSLYALFVNHDVTYQLSLHPYSINRGSRYYTILTSGLVHADIGHLLFNMMTFYFFAFRLEATIGHWQFALLYTAGLILSDVSTIAKYKNSIHYYSLGASGAISAVLFSYILFDPLTKLYIMFIPIGIPAVIFGPIYLAYCVYASRHGRDNINHDAHFYGAVTGIVLTILLFPSIIGYFMGTIMTALN
ncbi:rhomboid family intramembrane serine protease [Solitalea koreensis]|uniref:Membrane associated serine protease, rhomboid family n=1 Tax=Solitalea koreensis TaxID=543615 RepID=A0A521C8T5_9SPHI|nr:rhomboid family intramembrane serine protease [Solitalea koreensis]SMO55785.1 Membrane associated serine protease, rhomboid family [Solitalea koreensis]